MQKACPLSRGRCRVRDLKAWAESEARARDSQKVSQKGKTQLSEGKRGGSLFLPGAPHGGRDEAPREIQMKSHVDAEARFKLFTRCGHSTPGNEYKNQSPTCKAQQMQNQDGSVAVFFKTWDTGEIALLRNAFFSFGIRTGGQPQTKSLPFGGGRFFPPCWQHYRWVNLIMLLVINSFYY